MSRPLLSATKAHSGQLGKADDSDGGMDRQVNG